MLESNILYGYTEQGVLNILVPVAVWRNTATILERGYKKTAEVLGTSVWGSECQIQTSVSHQCESLNVMDFRPASIIIDLASGRWITNL